jgi:uncharacterized OsmC-like protein
VSEVVVRSHEGLQQRIQIGDHHLVADEPLGGGGHDAGPNPYELLLSALGARKGWPLEGVEVALQHERIHAEDCADCGTREGFLDKITKQLTLLGPQLDDEQRQRLFEIAERCPVQRTLQREIVIEQHLKGT